jgi:hypothetical protein
MKDLRMYSNGKVHCQAYNARACIGLHCLDQCFSNSHLWTYTGAWKICASPKNFYYQRKISCFLKLWEKVTPRTEKSISEKEQEQQSH